MFLGRRYLGKVYKYDGGEKGMLTVILQLVKGRVGIKNCNAGVHRGEPVMWK